MADDVPELEWGTPPPKRAGGGTAVGAWDMTVVALRDNPGKWARLVAGRDKQPSTHALKRVGCETTVRRLENGTWDLWARWPVDGGVIIRNGDNA